MQPLKRWVILALIVAAIFGLWWIAAAGRKHEPVPTPPAPADSRQTTRNAGGRADRGRSPRPLTSGQWQHAVESILGHHEAARARVISRKETVDSKLYLLGVEPPAVDEIEAIREKLEKLTADVTGDSRAACEEKLAALVEDYDAYGERGRRVIQIDVPSEPNGRLTGFTCDAGDFGEMARMFQEGEMAGLENLRGYSATYAGMPLNRFDALVKEDGLVATDSR